MEILTIGHSNLTLEHFLHLLEANDVRVVADVRRFPGSRRHPQFAQEALRTALENQGIEYLHLAELGGRRKTRPDSKNTAWRVAAFRGYADYMETDEFGRGIRQLLERAQATRTCIMCAETLWWRCHRALISDWLKARGYCVLHILANGKLQEHPYTSAASIVDGHLTYCRQN